MSAYYVFARYVRCLFSRVKEKPSRAPAVARRSAPRRGLSQTYAPTDFAV